MAIDELLDEHEQGERVRAWLRRNGLGIVLGIALGIGIIGGWRWWQGEAHADRVAAGDAYAALQDTLAAGDLDKAATEVAALGDEGYGPLAAMQLARAQLDAGKRDVAIETLRGVASPDPALAAVVRQRLARLLIDAGQGQEAATLMAAAEDPVGLEVLGDAHAALGARDAARQAYERALSQLDVAAPQRGLLEIKLMDAGGVPAKPEART